MARALDTLVPRILGDASMPVDAWDIREFSSKSDLLKKLPGRMKGYSSYAEAGDVRVLVLVDRDDDDCLELKETLEDVAKSTGLATRSTAAGDEIVRVCNRIVVEELEAWFIGDPEAVAAAYPKVPVTFVKRKAYRYPDDVSGGTWEALERLLQQHGYYPGGLAKVSCAKDIAAGMQPDRNTSPSFRAFHEGLLRLVGAELGG